MVVVTLSSKFQAVIPEDIRKKIDIKPGQKIAVIEKDGIISLIPQKPIKEMRGFLKGMKSENIRDEEDRFWFWSTHMDG